MHKICTNVIGAALEWLKSCFRNRDQFVHVTGASACPCSLISAMPQGSALGPFGFPTYTSPLGKICTHHGVSYHLYADDIQIYIAFDLQEGADVVSRLERFIEEVSEWMKIIF